MIRHPLALVLILAAGLSAEDAPAAAPASAGGRSPVAAAPADRTTLEQTVARHRAAVEADPAVVALREAREKSHQAHRAASWTDEHRRLDQIEDQAKDALHRAIQDRLAADPAAAPLVAAVRDADAALQAAEAGTDTAAVDRARAALRAAKDALHPHRERIAEDPGLAPLRDAFIAAGEAKRAGQSTPEIIALRDQADADNRAYKAAVRERLQAIPEAAAAMEALAAQP